MNGTSPSQIADSIVEPRWASAGVAARRPPGRLGKFVADDFDGSILDKVSHRPWPMPDRPWVMRQTWHDLLFAHWPVNARYLRSKVPPQLDLDLFDGDAWIGIVPFRMTNVAPRGLPSWPWISRFAELNVRTYVRSGQTAGVYFFSLDAARMLAVAAARAWLNLPYHSASMKVSSDGGVVAYESRRIGDGDGARFRARYAPTGASFEPEKGTLEYFLTERYCLYNVDHSGTPYRLDIHHPRWKLRSAQADVTQNGMAAINSLVLPRRPPLLHFAARQDMVAWPARSMDASRRPSARP